MYLNIVTAVDIPAAWPVFKPAVDPATLTHKQLLRGEFWRTIPAYADVDEQTFLDHAWQARNSITRVERLFETVQDLASQEFLSDVARGFNPSPMSVRRVAVPGRLIDWSRPYEDPLRRQFIPVRVAAAARSPASSTSTRCTSRPTRRCPASPTATPTRRCSSRSTPARSTAGSARAATRSASTPTRSRRSPSRPTTSAGSARSRYIASRPELEDIVVSGGDAYQLRAEQITEIGDAPARDAEHPAHPLRDQGPGGDAAEDPHRRRVGRRADARSSSKGRKLHKEVVAPHALQPPERDHRDHRSARWTVLFERGITVRNQSRAAARRQRHGRDDDAAGQAPRPRQRAPVLRLRARPREGRRGSAHHAADRARHREARARRHGRASTRRPSWSTPRAAAASATCTRFEHYDRETGISVFTAPSVKKGGFFLYFDPLDTLSRSALRRWQNPAEQEAMTRAAIARARRLDRPFSGVVRGVAGTSSLAVEERAWR